MTTRSPTALIVHAHPEPASFATAQMREAERSLRGQGHDVTVIDLHAESWDPVLDRGGFPAAGSYFKPQAEQLDAVREGRLADDVARHLELVRDADLLVLSFPLWWFSMPAILKGWVDRVFVMGALFGGGLGLFEEAAMVGRRAVLLVTTGGAPHAFGPGARFGDLDTLLFHIHHGTLRFVGYDVLRPVITFGPAHLDGRERAQALADVRAAFDDHARRALVEFASA